MLEKRNMGKIARWLALLLTLLVLLIPMGTVAALSSGGALTENGIQVHVPNQGGDIDTTVLQDHGVFTVAFSENYRPFSYTDTDGNAAGISVDIMNYIAELADMEVEYVSVGTARRDNMDVDINLAILEKEQMDGITITSIPYTSFQMVLASHTEQADTVGATVGHLAYQNFNDERVTAQLENALVYTYYTYSEMAYDFMDGDLDYMLVSSLVSNTMMETDDDVGVYMIPTDVKLDINMRYADTMTAVEIETLDNVIRGLNSDYIYTLMLNSAIASSSAKLTAVDVLQTYALPILIAVLALFLGIIAAIFIVSHNKRKFLEKTINVDELTGLMTERKFLIEAEKLLEHSEPNRCAIVTIDIDNFKTINEVYGYEVGTQTIIQFAEVLKALFADSCIITRFFADNFGVLYQLPEELMSYISQERYESSVTNALQGLLGEGHRLATSAGIYIVEDTTLPLTYMIDCANMARRQGKSSYGFTQHRFTDLLDQQMHQKNTIVHTMEDAITNREFQVYYQPKISLETGKLVGAEALVRWILPNGQCRYPDSFIPIFESNGFISKVDHFVLKRVCEFLVDNPTAPKVAINFSGVTMLDETMMEQVSETVKSYGIDTHRLEVEITESAMVSNFERIVEQTAKLGEMGFTISVDDFGAGVSSLNRLNEMDIDVLKIDKVFLGERALTQRSISILEHIIGMTKKLEIATVAEGVENQEQVNVLTSMGCDMAQGYHYARPMPESAYLDFMQKVPEEKTV